MSRSEWLAFTMILLLAATLRLWELSSKSFWLDEILEASRYIDGLAGIPEWNRWDTHPSVRLYINAIPYWLNHGIAPGRFPFEWELRLVPALTGVAAVALMVPLMRRWASYRIALVGAFLLAINRHHIEQSQNARMYSAFFFFSLLTLLATDLLAAKVERGEPLRPAAGFFLVASGLNLSSSYLALPLLAIEIFWMAGVLARSGRWKLLCWLVTSLTLLTAIAIPGLGQVYLEKGGVTIGWRYDQLRLFCSEVWVMWFASPLQPPGLQNSLSTICFSLALLGLLELGARNASRVWLFGLALLLPSIALLILSFESFFAPRYVLFQLGMLLVLQALGIAWLQRRAGTIVALLVTLAIVGLSLPGLRDYYGMEKQNWRAAVQYLVDELPPGKEVPVLAGPVRTDKCLIYYLCRAGFSFRPVIGPTHKDNPKDPSSWYDYILMKRRDRAIRIYPPNGDSAAFWIQAAEVGTAFTVRPVPLQAWEGWIAPEFMRAGRLEKEWPGQFSWGDVACWRWDTRE